jgi:hypothetical protein
MTYPVALALGDSIRCHLLISALSDGVASRVSDGHREAGVDAITLVAA